MRWPSGHLSQAGKRFVTDTVVIKKEMGLSHREFFRTIASALGTDDFESWDTGVRLLAGDKKLEIRLGEQGERRIALLVVPRTMVTLEFTGYTEGERNASVKRFDMKFKRGGG